MKSILAFSKRFMNDESGQDLIEYALVAGLIGLVAVAGMTSLGSAVNTGFTSVSSTLSNAL